MTFEKLKKIVDRNTNSVKDYETIIQAIKIYIHSIKPKDENTKKD